MTKLRAPTFKHLASDYAIYKGLALNSYIFCTPLENLQLYHAFSAEVIIADDSESPSLVFFCFQFKKHRLSVVHTNTYAKSVVNMADLVSINPIQYCHRGILCPDY